MDIQPESVLSVGATLGEGPLWVVRDAALWFVDIKQHRVHRFDPALGILRSWTAPSQVGWIVPTDDGLFAVGLQTGIHRFDPAHAAFTPLHAPEAHLPGNRLNDASVDARGRLWFGSMDDAEEQDSGRIYRLFQGQCVDSGLPPVSITNGPAFSPDGGILYHHDTLGRRIWKSRLTDEGHVIDTSLIAQIEDGAGYPDGPTVDAEGCLWVGLFAGWGVRRYDPDGKLMGKIAFPVANVTKIAFGDDRLSTAYATTARKGLSAAELKAQPLAGDLFAFDPGVCGVPGVVANIGAATE
ncbi:SMP-30/gluconolactonase/LRE family protein [Sphingobium sp. H39-3-25]|uniref:SMP-30/gluconolactonase/LRE family protein n=1 Tax=Sphingobium arseniciresistens TaxID=3030834 RepID=UPI0023B9E54B|nr:SMP-30/gluconolactonase/LRE family protein [Sphingobium arseniciresistens]